MQIQFVSGYVVHIGGFAHATSVASLTARVEVVHDVIGRMPEDISGILATATFYQHITASLGFPKFPLCYPPISCCVG